MAAMAAGSMEARREASLCSSCLHRSTHKHVQERAFKSQQPSHPGEHGCVHAFEPLLSAAKASRDSTCYS